MPCVSGIFVVWYSNFLYDYPILASPLFFVFSKVYGSLNFKNVTKVSFGDCLLAI